MMDYSLLLVISEAKVEEISPIYNSGRLSKISSRDFYCKQRFKSEKKAIEIGHLQWR